MSERSRSIRLQNARIAATARRHHFRDGAEIAFLCECDDERCGEFVLLSLAPYDALRDERLYIVAPGHTVGSSARALRGRGYDAYRAVA